MTLTQAIRKAKNGDLIVRWSDSVTWTDEEYDIFPLGHPVGHFDDRGTFVHATDDDIYASVRVTIDETHYHAGSPCTNRAMRAACDKERKQQLAEVLRG